MAHLKNKKTSGVRTVGELTGRHVGQLFSQGCLTLSASMIPKASLNSWMARWENMAKTLLPLFLAFLGKKCTFYCKHLAFKSRLSRKLI